MGFSLAVWLRAGTALADGPVPPAPAQAPPSFLSDEEMALLKEPTAAPALRATPQPSAIMEVSGAAAPAVKLPVTTAATVPAKPAGVTSLDVPLPAAAADAAKDYERAQALFDKGEEAQALISFTDFLRRYPEHVRALDAQFFLGELLFRQRKFTEAMAEYAKVRAVAKNPRLPATALRIGECWQRLGKIESARIEWNAVARRFRGTPAAEQARVLLKGLP